MQHLVTDLVDMAAPAEGRVAMMNCDLPAATSIDI